MTNPLLAIVLLFFITPCFGQLPAQPPTEHMNYDNIREYVIKDIAVSGVKYLQTNYLVNISGLSVGQTVAVPGEEITNAINKFWALGLFSDVKIYATEISGRFISLEIK